MPREQIELVINVKICLLHGLTELGFNRNLGSEESRGALRDLPIELSHLNHLEELLLWHNRFTHIPPVIVTLTNLRKLSLALNRIRDMPFVIATMRNLIELDVSNNQIAELPFFFINNLFQPFLRVKVENNPIRSIAGLVGDNIRGINMDLVEEMSVPFHEWFESHVTLAPLASSPIAYVVNPFILCINAVMRNVVLPMVNFIRQMLGYSSTIQIQLR